MNVLITGASGFVGRNLLGAIEAQGLRKHHRFLLLSSAPQDGWEVLIDQRENGRYSITLDDVITCGFTHVDALVHAGAFMPKRGAETNSVEGAVSNVFNTGHLVETFGDKLSRFVFISTVDVYGPTPGIISEATDCKPAGLYGKSKLFCEELLAARFGAGFHTKQATQLQLLRLSHIYGPGEEAFEKFIPLTIRNLIDGKPPVLFSTGEELRSFLHVSDCCRMILKSLELEVSPGPINIVSRRAIPIRDIAAILCNIHREETGESIEPEIQGRMVPTRDYVFDATKMEHYLGGETVDIVEGLRDEYRYFRSQHANIH